jgi:hypothetical protein
MRCAAKPARRRRVRRTAVSTSRRPPWRRWFPVIVVALIALTAPFLVHV